MEPSASPKHDVPETTRRDRVDGAQSSAFTLLELLVGVVILALLVTILSQMLSHTSGIWLMRNAQVEKSEGGRAILEFISKELQSAQLPIDRTDTASLQLLVNPTTLSGAYQNPNAIFWQAPVATDSTFGDLAEIGYFVQWDESTKGNPHANLCRFFVNPANPAVSSTTYLIYTQPTNWINDGVINAIAPANRSNNYQGLLVENVIGFWVSCLQHSGTAISCGTSTFDSRTGYQESGNTFHLPAAIDLSFVMIDRISAKRITSSMESAIKSAVISSTDANDFVGKVKGQPELRGILPGLSPCETRIYLQNSK